LGCQTLDELAARFDMVELGKCTRIEEVACHSALFSGIDYGVG
jgi:hypothetical protein